MFGAFSTRSVWNGKSRPVHQTVTIRMTFEAYSKFVDISQIDPISVPKVFDLMHANRYGIVANNLCDTGTYIVGRRFAAVGNHTYGAHLCEVELNSYEDMPDYSSAGIFTHGKSRGGASMG